MDRKILTKILNDLSENRPIFHSEADFQFALAWAIQQKYPQAEIRMERPYKGKTKSNKKLEIDIIIILNSEPIGIELKYVTKKLERDFNKEHFSLKEHAATNPRRYDFYTDIERLETLKEAGDIKKGFAIFLTNNKSYKKTTKGMGQNFNFSENYQIPKKTFNWPREVKENSVSPKRKAIIKLTNSYLCIWEKYYYQDNINFDYLMLEI